MGLSISGMGTGLDTAGIVSQLMQAERLPQTKITARQQAAQKQVTSWTDLRIKMQALQTAAEALRTPAKALGSVATSSDKDALTATATSDAVPGQYAVTVKQLATAQQQKLTGLGPVSMTVGAGRSYVVAGTDPASLDLSAATAGVHTVQVTRASSGATVYGTPVSGVGAAALPTSMTLAVDGGTARTLTLRPTHTDAADLLADLNGQLGADAVASVVGGRLQISSRSEGSARTLQLGGPAATALGLPTAVATGQAALLLVDGVSKTVEPQSATSTGPRAQSLGDSGITLSVGTGLRVGTTRANVLVTTDTSTLADLQSMLNVPGSPAGAALVSEGTTNTLVLSSTATGSEGKLLLQGGNPVMQSAFTETLEAKDAEVTVAGLTVTRSSNTITDLVPGVTLDLTLKPADGLPRTVTVSRDSGGTGDKAKALVDALNAFLTKVATDTKYDVKSQTGGPLVGDSTARSMASTLFSKAASTPGSGEWRALSQLGIQTTRDGKFELKADVMTAALAKDPDGVATMLSGFADTLATYAKTSADTGGLMTSRKDGAQAEVDARQKQFDDMEIRLAATEKRYKAQFTALETAMSRLSSQKSAMAAALGTSTSS
ncbi:MAG: flagellar hook-associated protein [Frankiales bacterium]|nr:flagellar hook-associated protein [Frankiales bacterium]